MTNSWWVYLLWFVCSGLGFWLGGLLLVFGIFSGFIANKRFESLVCFTAMLMGGFLVIISAIPLPWWLYAILVMVTLAWWILKYKELEVARKVRLVALVAWLGAFAFELPWWKMPFPPPMSKAQLLIIGDSITAGISSGEETWPKLLTKEHSIRVMDCSRAGATVRTAQIQADFLGDESGLLVLEIGGNDLLGGTPVAEFEQHLDRLLEKVCRNGRTVFMLELPLPPLANSFGLVQRKLSQKHSVQLVPRRLLAGVLLKPGATSDGIHLTHEGHMNMAKAIWALVGSAF